MTVKDKSLDGLAISIAKTINKKAKGSPFKFNEGISVNEASLVTDWIPTGCQVFDLAISNDKIGGYPCGRMTLLYGEEQSGKSLCAMHALASTQKKGGIGVYFDAEGALDEEFAEAIGLNIRKNFVYTSETQLETIFNAIVKVIYDIRKDYGMKLPLTIVVDSIESTLTEENIKNSFTNVVGYDTSKAKYLSTGLKALMPIIKQYNVCLIMTNQVKFKMNIRNHKYEDPHIIPGGKAPAHYASVIAKLSLGGKIQGTLANGFSRPLGVTTKVVIKKNRCGPPGLKIAYDIYYSRGIDNYGSWGTYVNMFKLVTIKGAWYSYEYVDKETGEIITYKENGYPKFASEVLAKNPKVAAEIWEKLWREFVICYRADESEMKIVKVDENDDEIVKPDDIDIDQKK